jgi:hypothetical protein
MRASRILILIPLVLAACDRVTVSLEREDPLATEIERWSAFIESRPPQDKLRQKAEPVLTRAGESLREGKRLLALQRLVAAKQDLAVNLYLRARPAEQRQKMAAFEAEWARMDGALWRDFPASLEGIHPAAMRALGEAAFSQVRAYYDASLEQGRNTTPGEGLYYLGAAQAQREIVDIVRTVSTSSSLREPPVRPLGPEIETLEGEMLAAYRPPVSIDRHGEFITASATLKEARELDEAGLRYGALLRYLQAALQFAPLRGPSPPLEDGALSTLETRLAAGKLDHSIGRLFLEAAQANLAAGSTDTAATIAGDVLPRYFAALEPARPREPGPEPKVTVTLVRWPYT